MNEITIPYHLVLPSIVCLIGLLEITISRRKLLSKNKLLWISIITFLIIYLFIVGTSSYYAIYYQWDLNRYDLDKNGVFNAAEITDAQQIAMSKLITDTGRNFSFITGFIFALIISITVYISRRIRLRIKTIKIIAANRLQF